MPDRHLLALKTFHICRFYVKSEVYDTTPVLTNDDTIAAVLNIAFLVDTGVATSGALKALSLQIQKSD